MSNPIHGVAVSPAMAGHVSELLQYLHMQASERAVERAASASERKANREEMRAMVVSAAEALAGLVTMLRNDKRELSDRDRKDRKKREKKEAEREAGRLAAKAALAQSDFVDEIVELKRRIDGYEADIAGMSTMLKQYRHAEESPKPETRDEQEVRVVQEAKTRVRNGIGQRRIVRPYGSAVPAEKDENYW